MNVPNPTYNHQSSYDKRGGGYLIQEFIYLLKLQQS